MQNAQNKNAKIIDSKHILNNIEIKDTKLLMVLHSLNHADNNKI